MIDSSKKNPAALASVYPSGLPDMVPGQIPSTPVAAEDHFSTGHLLASLKGRTVSSGIVTALSQAAQFGVNLASIMVLARVLTPEDFGLVTMVATVMGFLRIFNDAGLSTATVQREGITHAQVSNLFWTNVALGGLISLLLAVSAPAVAWFYREPRLVGITLALCVTFLLTGSTVQHLALLKRQMRFKMIAAIQVSAAVAGLVVGVGMAWLQCGYWSLVGMQLSTPAVAFLLTLVGFPMAPPRGPCDAAERAPCWVSVPTSPPAVLSGLSPAEQTAC
jgi:PST family polysaccharide transporter